MATLDKLVQAKKIEPYPYQCVIIDTFDRAIEFIEEDVIQWGRDKYKNSEIYSIGDCVEPRKLLNAIWEGFRSARLI